MDLRVDSLTARTLDTVHKNLKDDHGQLFGPGILTSAMGGGSICEILKEELKPMLAYNADMGARVKRGDAQPREDPVDPSPFIMLTSPEADADLLNEHGKSESEYLDWSTQLPGILFKMNSGLKHFFMPDCAQRARKIFIQDFSDESEV
ncbi:hypothetical protein FB451DRAFT_1184816 [Mycena latifolia]|nr:hypothetical protein FB451DRAFT_1184816 [Mycena latifolia]